MQTESKPLRQKVAAVQVVGDEHGGNPMDYVVGQNCSSIEIVHHAGEYAYIPYVRVWAGDDCLVEFCQHKATWVRYSTERLPAEDEINF